MILIVGLLAISTSPVIARLLPLVPAAVIAFWRMTSASVMLWGYSSIRTQESIKPKNIWLILAAGFLLAMHFIFWFGALKLTSIANTTILGVVAPAFTLLFERLWYRQTQLDHYHGTFNYFSWMYYCARQRSGVFTGFWSGKYYGDTISYFLGVCLPHWIQSKKNHSDYNLYKNGIYHISNCAFSQFPCFG